MSYELRPNQSLGRNLRRIFRQQVCSAASLVRGEEETNDTLAHDVRKHLKKARAILQLASRQIGRRAFRDQDRRLREIGRLTREIRDAEVRLQTMRQLEDVTQRHYRSYQKIDNLLEIELENFLTAFDGWKEQALPLLGRADKLAKEWPRTGYKEGQLRRAMQRTYKRARKALEAARREPSVANIHRLRKQVKSLGYEMAIIQPWNHVVVSEAHRELTELGHLLGRVHDLILLADRLRLERRETHWGKQDDELLATIESSKAVLQRDGIESAQRFFAERPREFAAHIDEWFEDRKHCHPAAETLLAA